MSMANWVQMALTIESEYREMKELASRNRRLMDETINDLNNRYWYEDYCGYRDEYRKYRDAAAALAKEEADLRSNLGL